MVKLYGAASGAYTYDLIRRIRREHSMPQSKEFLKDLVSLPKGTKVGIGWLDGPSWMSVVRDLDKKWSESKSIEDQPHYPDDHSNYWHNLIHHCKEASINFSFLESPDLWLRYNSSMVEIVNHWESREEGFVRANEESDRDYHKRLLQLDKERLKLEIGGRKIHEIEREQALLEAIKEQGVDVAIVGLGHGDAIYDQKDEIKRKLGIDFESYSADEPIFPSAGRIENPFTIFNKKRTLDHFLLAERKGLERSIRLLEGGRLVEGDRCPDYVGTWDISRPFMGYFEVFVREKVTGGDGRYSGVIEDCLGTADFEGRLGINDVKFTKIYRAKECMKEAYRDELNYHATSNGEGFYGYFNMGSFRAPFYMMGSFREDPNVLSMHYVDAIEKEKAEKKSEKPSDPEECPF